MPYVSLRTNINGLLDALMLKLVVEFVVGVLLILVFLSLERSGPYFLLVGPTIIALAIAKRLLSSVKRSI